MGQLRKKTKALTERVREGDADAAIELLQHSVRLGHSKLALRRLFLTQFMGAAVVSDDLRFCLSILNRLPRVVTGAMAEDECLRAGRL